MRIFISAGEPSGDVHGSNLIKAVQRLRSGVEFHGFGGDRMTQAGCKLMFPLCNHAVMGLAAVLPALPQFMSLVSQADRYFHHRRPDAVVLIDYPGFNWWLARRAHFHGIPVFYFVPPQIWAWASFRVSRMRRWVDHVLCSLPFEEPWYRERGVTAEYVGHPFFDEVPAQQLDLRFLAEQEHSGGTIIGLLPGSRTMEVERNFPTQLKTAAALHQVRPDTRFLAACYKESHRKMAEDMRRRYPSVPVQLCVGRTPEIIELSKMCCAVSGSVSLELLYRVKPTVIVYRMPKLQHAVIRRLVQCRWATLVNLLADKELYPEFVSSRCEAEGATRELLRWLTDERSYAGVCRELLALREKVARPGACARTAQRIIDIVKQRQRRAA